MNQKMTWEDMKKAFPDEWLLITDYETNKEGDITVGIVERHSKDDKKVFEQPSVDKDCAFRYTGESQFPGGWRAHAKLH